MRGKIEKVYYWTDSRTVICWLNTKKALKAFVANKVGEILERSTPTDWRWISTTDNVADEGTRDTGLGNLQGPEFLQRNERDWCACSDPEETLEAHQEFSDEVIAVNIVTEFNVELSDALRFSSWKRLIRATAYFYKFIEVWQKRDKLPLTPDDEEAAVKRWIKFLQNEQYSEEIKALRNNSQLKQSSKLVKLSPILDVDGIMRAGGRLMNAKTDAATRNPIILDGNSYVVRLLVFHYHCRANHSGRELVLNELRQNYWIVRVRSVLRTVIYNCQHCRKMKPQVLQPAMGQLPDCRLQSYCPPFSYCGMDYFGPFEVTVGRHREKRYGVIFTCMTTRAIHVEMAHSLTTDSCILALRRMITRRRKPEEIYSDNGTNLRGADRELREALDHLSFSDIKDAVLLRGIKWKFNPPAASHMGGAWERLIRSIRTALRETLNERAPRQEVLETVLAEAEHLVNTRPLTYVSADVNDPEALTPNHILTGATSNVQSPGVFDQHDLDWGKQWRKAQALIDLFWTRWLKEYLPTLIPKQKWTEQRCDLNPGDIVYITDMLNERGRWPMGLIEQCYPGQDDIVRVVDVKTCSGIYRRPTTKLRKIRVEGSERP
ncbi:uncharacterized protein LOC128740019 [Sabethes cyaneus]|uniref:uncharacterized protein LOC128740019 n=1 Tax=Sabethes cyaneus TaxID=53552 RepID=UPI00237EC731|nr:uncharacterized protein LOC128740019 [Sabethes cyaneus]